LKTDNIIITDIGSTTTKALHLQKNDREYQLIDYVSAFTTVEKPDEDVNVGIRNAISQLCLDSEYTYLTTSSAGGGLQILVIGLTTADSAKSAERAAYGVGGVLLDTLAIDDGKTMHERLKVINSVFPDIILLCGGVDGGALISVYRLASLLRIANVYQKFSNNTKIPLIYAGNCDAVGFITAALNEKYDLHIVPNLRPKIANHLNSTAKDENLIPTQEKIHELFLNSVMEQAPGYSKVKTMVEVDIIPTPAGVLQTIKLLGKKYKNILAFDMGGATTDFYSNIDGNYHRSVSANIGMSYSIGNILAECDFERDIAPHLSTPEQAETILNYIGNKILYPGSHPTNEIELYFEHIIAICGIKMSIIQHKQMYFKSPKTNLLAKIRSFFNGTQSIFQLSEVEMAIGSGGVISVATPEQAIFIMIQGLQMTSFTTLWRDKHFISPHLGVLSDFDETLAEKLIHTECIEKLAVYIRAKRTVRVKIDDKKFVVKQDNIWCVRIENSASVEVNYDGCFKRFYIEAGVYLIVDTRKNASYESLLNCFPGMYKMHQSPNDSAVARKCPTRGELLDDRRLEIATTDVAEDSDATEGYFRSIRFSLPFAGTVYVQAGDSVTPETLLAENPFELPKLYVLLVSAYIGRDMLPEELDMGMLVKIGDTVQYEQKVYQNPIREYFIRNYEMVAMFSEMTERDLTAEESDNIENLLRYPTISEYVNLLYQETNAMGTPIKEIHLVRKTDTVYSPLRGKVESIDMVSGIIVLQEIQDYPLEPVHIDVAKLLDEKPEFITGFMKKSLGDLVFQGEFIAEKMRPPTIEEAALFGRESTLTSYRKVIAPSTGNITEINTQTGIVTILYDAKPYKLYSMCYGTVEKIVDNRDVYIAIDAVKIAGKIGFGTDVGGELVLFDSTTEKSYQDKIVYALQTITYAEIEFFRKNKIKGLICHTISYSTLYKFLGKHIGVALTGNEVLPFSLIILDGFCHSEEQREKAILTNNIGKYTLLIPQTQIRAGAQRPEIIISKLRPYEM
jgi:uncharacterized protein (TIGR01319 family)